MKMPVFNQIRKKELYGYAAPALSKTWVKYLAIKMTTAGIRSRSMINDRIHPSMGMIIRINVIIPKIMPKINIAINRTIHAMI
jgi:hypothetical protein